MTEMNVVPYIDVMLVLLVIFMVTAPVLFHGIEVNLPIADSKAVSAKAAEPIVMSIDAKGRYYLNIAPKPNRALNRAEVTKLLLNQRASLMATNGQQLLIKGDRNLAYQEVAKALVLLQDLGIGNVGLITKLEDAD